MKRSTHLFLYGLFSVLLLVQLSSSAQGQTTFRQQAWRFGAQLGLNYNSASLGYQDLHVPYHNFDKPNTNTDENINGTGYGAYGGIIVEYLSSSWWGVQIRSSYDMRDATVVDVYATPTHTEFITRMSYLSFEPALRIDQHLIPGLSLTAGGLVAANIHGTYDFKADANGPVTDENVKVPDRSVVSLGVTGGVAYDFELLRSTNGSFFLSPFADYSWIAAQRKSVLTGEQNSSNDIWSTQTFRAGVRLSWELRSGGAKSVTMAPIPVPPRETPRELPAAKRVAYSMPADNTILTKNITGYYPILPYVFFEKGNQDIPARYIRLSSADAQSFNESVLGNFEKDAMTVQETNIDQLMIIHLNVMNIFGARMRKNPNEQLTLRGCDPEEHDGEACARNVRAYLVGTFGISPSRISIVVEPPRKPSGSALTDPAFSGLIDDENRRVSFVFSNQDMYMPVSYRIRDESSIVNDMVFSIRDDVPFKSWDVSISGESKTMRFGPFTSKSERVNPAPLMRGLTEGSFNATVVITMRDGKQIAETVDFTLRKDRESKNASRYLMIFDYNKSDAVATYETTIRKVITPGMHAGNTVIIHGHTDIIGNEAANQLLSQQRAEEAKRIVDSELGNEHKVVSVQAIGIGQTKMQYTFDNRYPEGRMYNRNVFVEVME